MRRLVSIALFAFALSGCAGGPAADGLLDRQSSVCYDNPTLLASRDPECVWENLVDVVDDYFRIGREVPVKQMGDVLTEGRLETFPTVGSTLLEPWHHDSANHYEKLESTLQSIRRRAVVRVVPCHEGYQVDVVVYKELEDVAQPEFANAGDATFRYDDTLRRVVNPVGGPEVTEGWIPLGRDPALEQRIIAQLHSRLGNQMHVAPRLRQLPPTSPPQQLPPQGVVPLP